MKKRANIRFFYILLIVLAGFGAVSLYMSLQTQQAYNDDVVENSAGYDYDVIQEMVTLPEFHSPSADKSFPDPSPEPSETPTESTRVPSYDVEEMMSLNSDFKGWLWIPDTAVNYPVVQADSNDKYLRRSFLGEYCRYGSLFFDETSAPGSRNRVIHGHNMGDGRTEMFSTLIDYQNQKWAEARLFAYFIEPDNMEDSQYQLFAVLNFDIKDIDEFNYFQTDFETEEAFHEFVDYLKRNSLFKTDFYPEEDILILSTCNVAYGQDNRLLICYGHINTDT